MFWAVDMHNTIIFPMLILKYIKADMYHCVTTCALYIKICVVAVKTWPYHCLYLGRVNEVIRCQIIKRRGKKSVNNSVIFAFVCSSCSLLMCVISSYFF